MELSVALFGTIMKQLYPLLREVAREELTPTATSVPSGQAFSDAANQIWARRNKLGASSTEILMFLLNNLEPECGYEINTDA